MDTRQNDIIAQNDGAGGEQITQPETVRIKKAYEKPIILHQSPLEAMAATCSTFPGKAAGICGTGFS